jgi:hypothetical protein
MHPAILRSRTVAAVVVAFGLLAAACSSPGDAEVPSTNADSSQASPSDRPLAPDFTMALESGGTFTLSEAQTPVYLVFWAEW